MDCYHGSEEYRKLFSELVNLSRTIIRMALPGLLYSSIPGLDRKMLRKLKRLKTMAIHASVAELAEGLVNRRSDRPFEVPEEFVWHAVQILEQQLEAIAADVDKACQEVIASGDRTGRSELSSVGNSSPYVVLENEAIILLLLIAAYREKLHLHDQHRTCLRKLQDRHLFFQRHGCVVAEAIYGVRLTLEEGEGVRRGFEREGLGNPQKARESVKHYQNTLAYVSLLDRDKALRCPGIEFSVHINMFLARLELRHWPAVRRWWNRIQEMFPNEADLVERMREVQEFSTCVPRVLERDTCDDAELSQGLLEMRRKICEYEQRVGLAR